MKRRIVTIWVMVLLAASVSRGALSLVVNGVESGNEVTLWTTDNIWIGIYDDANPIAQKFIGYVAIAEESYGVPEAGGSWTGGNNYYSPPAVPGGYNYYMGYYTGYGDIWYLKNADATTNVPGIGLQAEYEFHAEAGPRMVVVNLLVTAATVLDTLYIFVPEPITMALLGLGGLLLRCRQ